MTDPARAALVTHSVTHHGKYTVPHEPITCSECGQRVCHRDGQGWPCTAALAGGPPAKQAEARPLGMTSECSTCQKPRVSGHDGPVCVTDGCPESYKQRRPS